MRRFVFMGLLFLFACSPPKEKQNDTRIKTITVQGRETLLASQPLHFPRFIPDGSAILATQPKYQGLNLYRFASGRWTRLSGAESAGFGYVMSPDSRFVCARERLQTSRRRSLYRMVRHDLNTGDALILKESGSLSLPHLDQTGTHVLFLEDQNVQGFQLESGTPVQPEDCSFVFFKIDRSQLIRYTPENRTSFQPFGDAMLVSVQQRPGRQQWTVEVAGQGSFLIDKDAHILRELGDRRQICWAPEYDCFAYVVEEDDGHRITRSDVMAAWSDSLVTKALTQTRNRLERAPSWSPSADKVVCHTEEGEIDLISVKINRVGVSDD